jgi:hypothetical protein
MNDYTFQEIMESATYLIGELFERFECEVSSIEPHEKDRIAYAFEALQHLRAAVNGTLSILDDIEDDMTPFKEPPPLVLSNSDFEADVLRDLAALDDPKKRPVSANEVMAWSKEYIHQHWKV